MVHADLNHSHLGLVRHTQDRERHADVVVQVALGLADSHFDGQEPRNDFLGGRFSGAPGDANHRPVPPRAHPRGQPLERGLHARHHQLRSRTFDLAFHHRGHRAFAERGLDERVAVVIGPAQSEEQAAGPGATRIDGVVGRHRVGGERRGLDGAGDVLKLQVHSFTAP